MHGRRSAPARRLLAAGLLTAVLGSAGCTAEHPGPGGTARPSGAAAAPTSTAPAPQLVATPEALAGRALAVALPALARQAIARDTTLVLPAGRYETAETVVLPEDTRLQLQDGAVVTGALPGRSLLRLAAASTLTGGTLQNTAATAGFGLDLAQGATRVTVRGVAFRGVESNGVYLNAPGIADVRIERSTFTDLAYGVLLNPGALGAKRITIVDDAFRGMCADAVEINAATGGTDQRVQDVVVTRNRMSGFCGSGPDAGFGVGLAGVDGFEISDNVIDDVRNEGVHLEDGTAGGVVTRNRITGGGNGDRPAIAVYRTVADVTVSRNRIVGFDGLGIAVRWDELGSAKDVRVQENAIVRVTGDGIAVAGGVGTGPFTVEGNTLETVGGDGIGVAGPHARSVIEDNVLTDVAGTAIAKSLRAAGVTIEDRNTVVP